MLPVPQQLAWLSASYIEPVPATQVDTPSDLESVDSDKTILPKSELEISPTQEFPRTSSRIFDMAANDSPAKARKTSHGNVMEDVQHDDDDIPLSPPPPDVDQGMWKCMQMFTKKNEAAQKKRDKKLDDKFEAIERDSKSLNTKVSSIMEENKSMAVKFIAMGERMRDLEKGKSTSAGVSSTSPFAPSTPAPKSPIPPWQRQQQSPQWQQDPWHNSMNVGPPKNSYAALKPPEGPIQILVGGWQFGTDRSVIEADVERLKKHVGELAAKIKSCRVPGPHSRMAFLTLQDDCVADDFWRIRETITDDNTFKLNGGNSCYMSLKKDMATVQIEREIGKVFRAMCFKRGVTFLPNEKHAPKGRDAGIERTWHPHHVIYADSRRVCWWDEHSHTVVCDEDALTRCKMDWNEILDTVTEQTRAFSRQSR